MRSGFYVSVIRSAKQRRLLLGPYEIEAHALLMVPVGRALATNYDQWCEFDAFGICKIIVDKNVEMPSTIFGII